MEEEEEQNRYVAQLKEEFDSCDTTGTGYLDKEELTVLCHKLHLDAHLPVLLGTLLGPNPFGRVNFEEFKEGFVAVLANSLDLSTSEEESSYLEPVVPEEVKPKFVKGTKRYGRRTRPDRPDPELRVRLEGTSSLRTDQAKSSPVDEQRAKLRRSTSLESVESLKSDDGVGSNKETSPHTFQAQGQLKRWKRDSVGSSWHTLDLLSDGSDQQMQALWANLGVGGSSFLDRQELSLVCESIGLQDLPTEELDALFRKLDQDQDGRVSLKEFQRGFLTYGILPRPTSCSTPIHPHPLHSQAFMDSPVRSASRSLLSATVGQRLLTRLDDGSGCASPECVIAVWNEEGIRNSQEILQTLDFSLEEKLSLAELNLALDNELLVSGNSIHQAALVSYKNEIQFLQVQADQARRERDKAKVDLERAEQRNLHLVREVDDRHSTMELLNETKIRGLEQEYRDKLMSLRTESEMEKEVLLQQAEQERTRLQQEVDSLRVKEVNLHEEVSAANEENNRLEREVSLLRGKLSDSETTTSRLQKDLDHLLLDKLGLLDTGREGLLGQEERFADIIREYEQQCRELRDRNDELNSELEILKTQGPGKRSRKTQDRISIGAWPSLQEQMAESDSDDPEKKKGTPLITSKKLQVTNMDALSSLESLPVNMSIDAELFVEQLKEKHSQEVQELKIELETKVNFYERSLELMRCNMEVERKDISQGFKLEISELEEQKALAEEREARLRESLVQLQAQLQASAWGPEQEKRAQREWAELEQNYAREISNLVQKLTSEKEQLEAELKLKMDQEVQLVREEVKQQLARAMPQYTEVQCALQEQEAWDQELQVQGSQKWKRLEDTHKKEAWSLQDKSRTLESQGTRVETHSRHLEAELKKGHSQSIERVASLKSQETLVQCLATDMCTKEEELEMMKMQENALLCKLSELASELRITNGEYDTLLKEVREKEDKLEEMQEVLRSSEASLLKKATELKSVEEEKAKLEEGLQKQSATPEKLRIFNYQKDHLIHRRNSEESLMDPLSQGKSKIVHKHPIFCSEKEQGVCSSGGCSQDTYLTVKLSFQIQELEVESSKLRRVMQDLSLKLKQKDKFVLALQSQLETEAAERGHLMNNVTQTKSMLEHQEELCKELANKVQLLTIQLEDKEQALCAQMQQSGNSCSILQKALQEAQAQTRRVEEEFEREKSKMRDQLLDMEKLVMAVEAAMDQASPHRRQLTEVTTENTALNNKHARLQQDIERLEDEVSKKRKKLEEMEKEHEQNREEVERLYKENTRHREEVLELSSRNLELSGENAELSTRLRTDQEAVRLLRERLEQLSQEREEELVAVSELQESLNRQEHEKEKLEHKLEAATEKLQQLSAVETELSGLTLKYQWQEEEKKRLLKEADERTLKVEQLQESLCSLSTQTEQLRSQLQAANLHKAFQAQEASTCQRTLQEVKDKVQELESIVERMRQEKEQLRVAHQQQQQVEEEAQALRRECQSLRCQNQELFCKVSQLKVQEVEVHKVNQESHTLKTKQAKLEIDVQQAQEQRLQADTALALAQSQHARDLQQLREKLDQGCREQLCQIEAQLAEEHRRVEQLEGQLNHQAHQASTQMGLQQEQYERTMKWMEEKMEEADAKVKNLRMVLQEKVIQLKEQLSKNAKLDVLLKDLYVENSQLMKAVQVTEQWQKRAERKNYILEEKIAALNMLLRKIAPASLSV